MPKSELEASRSRLRSERYPQGNIVPGLYPNSIRDDIIDLAVLGEIPLSTKTSELNLANRLGFKQRSTPVREVLIVLAHSGIVRAYPQSGYEFLEPSLEEAQLSMRARADIVNSLMDTILARPTISSPIPLDAIVNVAGEEGDPQALIKHESQFFLSLADAAGAATLRGQIETFNDKLRLYHAQHPATKSQMAGKLVWMETLADLIRPRATTYPIAPMSREPSDSVPGAEITTPEFPPMTDSKSKLMQLIGEFSSNYPLGAVSLPEIGSELGLSAERVRQIYTQLAATEIMPFTVTAKGKVQKDIEYLDKLKGEISRLESEGMKGPQISQTLHVPYSWVRPLATSQHQEKQTQDKKSLSEQVTELRNQGLGYKEIATELGKSRGQITYVITDVINAGSAKRLRKSQGELPGFDAQVKILRGQNLTNKEIAQRMGPEVTLGHILKSIQRLAKSGEIQLKPRHI